MEDPATNPAKLVEELDGNVDQDGPPREAIRRVNTHDPPSRQKSNSLDLSGSPKATFLMRRTSGASNIMDRGFVSRRIDTPEIREHLKHLGPSNLASRPRTTRFNTVKIKSGVPKASDSPLKGVETAPQNIISSQTTADGGVGEGLVQSAGKDAKDGVHALQVGYGTVERPLSSKGSNKGVQVGGESLKGIVGHARRKDSNSSAETTSTIRSLPQQESRTTALSHATRGARSGSITENVIETGGIKKVVLEPTSSSSDDGLNGSVSQTAGNAALQDDKAGKKKRRKKRKKANHSESSPLLDGDQ